MAEQAGRLRRTARLDPAPRGAGEMWFEVDADGPLTPSAWGGPVPDSVAAGRGPRIGLPRHSIVGRDTRTALGDPNGVDDAWADSLEAWRRGVGRLTGNLVEVLEVSTEEAATKAAGRSQVWAEIRRDGRVVPGLGIDELRAVGGA